MAGQSVRLMQELILGLADGGCSTHSGSKRSVPPERRPCALAVLERARSFMQATGQSFEVALSSRERAIFHHPHRGSRDLIVRTRLIERCLAATPEEARHPLDDLLALGRENPNDPAKTSTWRT